MATVLCRSALTILLCTSFLIHVAFAQGKWTKGALASFTGDETGKANFGSCYGSIPQTKVLGSYVASVSAPIFGSAKDNECGGCFKIKCVSSRDCKPKQVTVTVGSSCGAKGQCMAPKKHFVLSKAAFSEIGKPDAGNLPIEYQRVPCRRKGSIAYRITGNGYWILVTPINVGGAGSLKALYVKGTRTSWIALKVNWGANWELTNNPKLVGQALSFKLVSRSGATIEANNVAPANWKFDQTYFGGQFQ